MSITPVGVTVSAATTAYSQVQNAGDFSTVFDAGHAAEPSPPDSQDFGATLQRTLDGVVETGHAADAMAAQGIAGHGNITDIVMAVSQAQLALQSTVAIRDRVVQAYQDIMKMPI